MSSLLLENPFPKKDVGNLCDGKNIYQSTILAKLKKMGAVKENKENGELRLQSQLLRNAILLHHYLKKKEGKHITSAINYAERIKEEESPPNGKF